MYRKITGPVVVLLSFIAITGAQASRDIEKMPSKVSVKTGYSVDENYKPSSPFSIDRKENLISNVGTIDTVSKSKSLLLKKDGLLSKELELWVNQNGYTLLWNSNRDYIIYSTITLHADSFDNILNELGKLFDSENYGLVIKQYEVNKVIIIDAR